MKNKPDALTAVLLCGGKGQRLRPLTANTPKALVPLRGKPLLHYLFYYLKQVGILKTIVCTGYKAEMIESFIHENYKDRNIICVNSGEASMTDRLIDAKKHIDGLFLVCYGDTLANINIDALMSRHEKNNTLATLTVYPFHSPFGIVHYDSSNHVSDFLEKPKLPYWINIGYILCNPKVFNYIDPNADMLYFLSRMVKIRQLGVYEHHGKHLTVNTDKEKQDAENDLVEFFTLIGGMGHEG